MNSQTFVNYLLIKNLSIDKVPTKEQWDEIKAQLARVEKENEITPAPIPPYEQPPRDLPYIPYPYIPSPTIPSPTIPSPTIPDHPTWRDHEIICHAGEPVLPKGF